jgi:tetratricopeptide (TPR) repeat protein
MMQTKLRLLFSVYFVLTLTSSIVCFAAYAAQTSNADCDHLLTAGNRLFKSKHFSDSIVLYKQALQKALQCGNDEIDASNALEAIGMAQMELRQFKEAHSTLLQCMALRKKLFGAESAPVAVTFQRMADVYNSEHDWQNAQRSLEIEIAIIERVFSPQHRYLSFPLNKLATILVREHNYSKCVEAAERGIKIRERSIGADSPDMADDYLILATGLVGCKQWQKAISVLENELKRVAAEPNVSQATRLSMLRFLAVAYRNQGAYERAIDSAQRCIELATRLGLVNHEICSDCYAQMARAAIKLQRWNIYKSANEFLAGHGLSSNYNKDEFFAYLYDLAEQEYKDKDLENADRHCKAALAAVVMKDGIPINQTELENVRHLFLLRLKYGPYFEAASLARIDLAASEKNPGQFDANLLTGLTNFAYSNFRAGNIADAENAFKRAIAIIDKYPDQNHSIAHMTVAGYAELLYKTGPQDMYIKMHNRAIALGHKY